MRLFDERGFEHVTIADIAAAADIAPRTFFALLPEQGGRGLPRPRRVLRRAAGAHRRAAEGETTIAVLRGFLADVIAETDKDDPAVQCRRRVITGSPALQEHDRQLMGNFERALADGIAGDLGVEPGSLRARVAAAAATAALGELERYFDKADPPDDPMAIFDEAFVFVQGGVEALQGRSGGD